MDIVLFGIQGSGKGTQANILKERFGYKIFETGAELRKISHENSELGKTVKTILEAGNLVSSEVVIDILNDFLFKCTSEDKIIFDGIPRNTEQQKKFDEIIQKYSRKLVCVEIEIPTEETIKRLTSRGRHDDTEDAIKNRIQIFKSHIQPIIQVYKEKNQFITVNGNQKIEEVTLELVRKLGIL